MFELRSHMACGGLLEQWGCIHALPLRSLTCSVSSWMTEWANFWTDAALSEGTRKHLTWRVLNYTKVIDVKVYSRYNRWYFGVLSLMSNMPFFFSFYFIINAYKLNLNSGESNLRRWIQVGAGREGLCEYSPLLDSHMCLVQWPRTVIISTKLSTSWK